MDIQIGGWEGPASKKRSRERACASVWGMDGHIKGTVEKAECKGGSRGQKWAPPDRMRGEMPLHRKRGVL